MDLISSIAINLAGPVLVGLLVLWLWDKWKKRPPRTKDVIIIERHEATEDKEVHEKITIKTDKIKISMFDSFLRVTERKGAAMGYVIALYRKQKLVAVLPQEGPLETEAEANEIFESLVQSDGTIELEDESGAKQIERFDLHAVFKREPPPVFDKDLGGWTRFAREKTPAEKAAKLRKFGRHK